MSNNKKTSWDQFTENGAGFLVFVIAVALAIFFPPIIALYVLGFALWLWARKGASTAGHPYARRTGPYTHDVFNGDGTLYAANVHESHLAATLSFAHKAK